METKQVCDGHWLERDLEYVSSQRRIVYPEAYIGNIRYIYESHEFKCKKCGKIFTFDENKKSQKNTTNGGWIFLSKYYEDDEHYQMESQFIQRLNYLGVLPDRSNLHYMYKYEIGT